jgi:hypothetical protein
MRTSGFLLLLCIRAVARRARCPEVRKPGIALAASGILASVSAMLHVKVSWDNAALGVEHREEGVEALR